MTGFSSQTVADQEKGLPKPRRTEQAHKYPTMLMWVGAGPITVLSNWGYWEGSRTGDWACAGRPTAIPVLFGRVKPGARTATRLKATRKVWNSVILLDGPGLG